MIALTIRITRLQALIFLLLMTMMSTLLIIVASEPAYASYGPLSIKRAPLTPKPVIMEVTVTSYNSDPRQTDDTPFITAYNTRVRDGIVAANFLPRGTKIRFPEYFGDKEFVVEDRMHRRFSDRVDIWSADYAFSREFGIRRVKMEILPQ